MSIVYGAGRMVGGKNECLHLLPPFTSLDLLEISELKAGLPHSRLYTNSLSVCVLFNASSTGLSIQNWISVQCLLT